MPPFPLCPETIPATTNTIHQTNMRKSNLLVFLLNLLPLFSLPLRCASHGLLFDPPQRGALQGGKFTPGLKGDPKAPRDPFWHFPAGDKNVRPGAGKYSQEKTTRFHWTEWRPTDRKFSNWRAGVCGDLRPPSPQHHMRGGKYYYDHKITRTFIQGGKLEAKISIVAHHNGFIEFHVCDVARCGGEISEDCFRKGHCRQLKRTYEPECESRVNRNCAPVDPKYPGRWYLPCSRSPVFDVYGGDYKMRFQLPADLSCEHCVLHWYWVSANGCNPPGVVDFFNGPRGPKWGTCRGQGGAVGGYTRVQRPCEGRKFPEEYYQCADISITPRDGQKYVPRTTPPRKVTPPQGTRSAPVKPRSSSSPNPGNGDLSLWFFADGLPRRLLKRGTIAYIDSRKFRQLTFEAKFRGKGSKVEFFVDGRRVWTDYYSRYFMMGNSGDKPKYWKTPIYNRVFTLEARANGQRLIVRVQLNRNS